MPDMNELLRWSIANTAPSSSAPAGQGEADTNAASGSSQPLSLTFRPAAPGASASPHAAALHSSERQLVADHDDSPASSPGPATPQSGQPLPMRAPAARGAKRSDLTTEMLDLILGKSDSITMKEKMTFALEENTAVDERVEALDDFEMVSLS